jgi:DNA-binding NarL/FixJ family response regulator
MIKIFIADDHAMFAEGVESLLASEPDFVLKGKAGTAADALRQLATAPPDVLILDINLPDQSGLEVCRQVREQFPQVKVLALSMHNDGSFISEMLRYGAQGYLLKNTDKYELINAIRAVAAGKTYFSKEVTDVIMRGLMDKKSEEEHKPKISRREKEVLQLIAAELTTQEIAAKLFLSEKTVESHRAALLSKLNARNIAGLIKAAIRWQLLDDDDKT